MNPQQAVIQLLKSGWTQAALADEVGISQSTIHRIKTGGARRRGVPFELAMALITLARALPVPAETEALPPEHPAP